MRFLNKTTSKRHSCQKLLNVQQLHNFISWISNQEAQINPKQQKHTPYSLYSMLNKLFLPKTPIFDPSLQSLNTYRLALSRYAFSTIFLVETQKISSAYAKQA